VIDSANPTQAISTISASAFAVVGPEESSTVAIAAFAVFLPMIVVIAFFIGWQTTRRRAPRDFAKQLEAGHVGVGIGKPKEAVTDLAVKVDAPRNVIRHVKEGHISAIKHQKQIQVAKIKPKAPRKIKRSKKSKPTQKVMQTKKTKQTIKEQRSK
jgi:hypothetical protein